MSSISRITGSLFSATNDNTIALANINFDFSLVKYEAPPEFRALGEKLSNRRRDEAEDGQAHQTARRLGALFEAMVPSTPHLLKAYGLRASEIARLPAVNPRGTKNDGPFEAYIGADGTSIWAAATSSNPELDAHGAHGPLAMHLLACMLARAWDAGKAIAIWVELVHERRNEVAKKLDYEPQHMATLAAARQEISRDHLATWDASARSWLRSADQAKESKKTQLMLILKNIELKIGTGISTYEQVTNAWRQAMIGMESLVKGASQEVSDGSILLALSAWHIYPDLIVLGCSTKNVLFADPLVRRGGVLTIGLHNPSESKEAGMQWSLTLSHLHYYGDPIKVETQSDLQRITMDELLLVALGGMFSTWETPAKEELAVARFLVALDTYLQQHETSADGPSSELGHIRVVFKAAKVYLESHQRDVRSCSTFVVWGRRRARDFIGVGKVPTRSLFGLHSVATLQSLTAPDDFECSISYHREIARQMGLAEGDAIVHTSYERQGVTYHEFATATPHLKAWYKRPVDGARIIEEAHCRWLFADTRRAIQPTENDLCCVCVFGCYESCRCELHNRLCSQACHWGENRPCQNPDPAVKIRVEELRALGEICEILSSDDIQFLPALNKPFDDDDDDDKIRGTLSLAETFVWYMPAPIYCTNATNGENVTAKCPSLSGALVTCPCLERYGQHRHEVQNVTFNLCCGDEESFGLFVRAAPRLSNIENLSDESLRQRATRARDHQIKLEKAEELISSKKLNHKLVWTYIQNLLWQPQVGAIDDPRRSFCTLPQVRGAGVKAPLQAYGLSMPHLHSLVALDAAVDIYSALGDSTVSLRVVSKPMGRWAWKFYQCFRNGPFNKVLNFQEASVTELDPVEDIPHALKFACIAYFESGSADLDPEELQGVVALASENSIFVAAELLCDPSDVQVDRNRVRRVVGNIGRPGMSLLVIPKRQPRIRPLSHSVHVVPYEEYDFKREDNFQGTSLHLSFTDWKRVLNSGDRGAMDEEACLVEAIVSVHDRGQWVGDIDVSKIKGVVCEAFQCICDDTGEAEPLISLDHWEEVLDSPEGDTTGIVRAKNNWVARLAATAILSQQGKLRNVFVAPRDGKLCMKCAAAIWLKGMGSKLLVIVD